MSGADQGLRFGWLDNAIARADAWARVRNTVDPSRQLSDSEAADRALAHLPPADLPATLASVDDVRRVCEAAGLEVAHASVAEPRAWSGPNGLYVYACIDETDRPRLAETTVENGSGLVADVHHDAPASVLYGAIQAARSTS